jgi:hypothetical protein
MRQEEVSKYLTTREDVKQDKPQVSEPVDSDFKDFILYVSLKNKNFESFEVLDLLAKHPEFKLRTHIQDVDITLPDGTHPEFEIRYWDIRFSNICNLKAEIGYIYLRFDIIGN